MVHPQLGSIRGQGLPGYRTWETDPVEIGSFGYRASISLSTKNAEPTEQELALMVSAMQVTEQFKTIVAAHLFQQYMDYERPAYRKTIGNPQFACTLTEADLPALREPSEIWRLIKGLLGVYVQIVDGVADAAYLFTTTFDSEHDFQIRFRNGELYEMGMDG